MRNRINLTPHHTAVVTAAASFPVSLSEAKTYLRVDSSDDDTLISDAIAQANSELETATRRSFIDATYKDVYDAWPLYDYHSAVVHRNPLSSVTSIVYLDADGDPQTLASANYVVDTSAEPGRIALADNATLPLLDEADSAVTITYVAGYGTSASDCPSLVKHYIYLWVNAAYCRRPLMAEELSALRAIETSLSYGL